MTTQITQWQQGLSCPTEVIAALEKFINQLPEVLGDRLLSIVLFGELARQELISPRSNINVMLVINQISTELLDQVRATVQEAQREFRLALMIVSENDLASSTDVFPIKFLDMQQHHRLLYGKDLLKDLKISHDHLRLRCEQELKNLLLKLRQFYLQKAHYRESLENILTESLLPFISDLAVLLKLKTGNSYHGQTNIVRAAIKDLCLNQQTMDQMIALKEGKSKPEMAEMKDLYNNFMQLVQQAAEIADQL